MTYRLWKPWRAQRCVLHFEMLEKKILLSAVPLTMQDPLAVGEETLGTIFVTTADLDGDGDFDLVGGSYFDGKVAWYENLDGKGLFGPMRVIGSYPSGTHVGVVADVDGDGDVDILFSVVNKGGVVFFENTSGKGDFAPGRMIATDDVFKIAVGDIDDDGDLDVVSISLLENTIRWYENLDGRAGVMEGRIISDSAAGVNSLALADLDGDGDADIVFTSQNDRIVGWFENRNRGRGFVEHVLGVFDVAPARAVVADFDGDGDIDVLSTSLFQSAVLFENLGEASRFEAHDTGFILGAAEPADMDGDGDLDVFGQSFDAPEAPLGWLENSDGRGTFSRFHQLHPVAPRYDPQPLNVHVADIDGDGDNDAFSAILRADQFFLFENIDGQGRFGTKRVISRGLRNPRDIASADVDGDGDLDIVAVSDADDKVVWFENTDGLGKMSEEKVITFGIPLPEKAELADIAGDGYDDIVVASVRSGVIAWIPNHGGGRFGTPRVVRDFGDAPGDIAVADLDGDGDLDIAFVLYRNAAVGWYENLDGKGTFSGVNPMGALGGLVGGQAVTASDIDGDGDIDVVAGAAWTNQVAWFENEDGSGTFSTPKRIVETFSGPTEIAIADFDEDGALDLAIGNLKVPTWHRNMGRGEFFEAGPALAPSVVRSLDLAIGDIDSDDDPDIAATSIFVSAEDGAPVIWFENVDGKGNFATQHLITPGEILTKGIHLVDIDGDGDLDIFVGVAPGRGASPSRMEWFRNDLLPKIMGDSNGDERVTAQDIDRFYAALRQGVDDPKFDLTGDGVRDQRDLDHLVKGILGTSYGDANLDGRFDSGDLVQVFQRGQYEDRVPGNSTWTSGDWNGDREFDTGDLVFAFQHGTYVAQADANGVFVTSSLLSGADPLGRSSPSVSRRQQPGLNIPQAFDLDGPIAPSRPAPVVAQIAPGLAHRPIRRNLAHAVDAAPRIGSGPVPADDLDPSATFAGDDQLFRQRRELISSPIPEARKAEGEKVLSILPGDHWE